MRFFLFSLLALVGLARAAEDTATLKEIFLEVSREDPTRIDIRFVFDQSPLVYPAYGVDFPALIHFDFTRTRISKTANYMRKVPWPLTSLSVLEKQDDDGMPFTRVDIGLDAPLPFTTDWKAGSICAYLQIPEKKRKKVVLHQGGEEGSGKNTIKSVTVEDRKDSLEIAVLFTRPARSYPVFMVDKPPALMVQFLDMAVNKVDSMEVGMPPVSKFRMATDGEVSALVFPLTGVVPYTVRADSNSLRIWLKVPQTLATLPLWKNKKFIYVSAGAAVLLGGTIALLAGGDDTPAGSGGGDEPPVVPPADTWNQPPPNPDDALE